MARPHLRKDPIRPIADTVLISHARRFGVGTPPVALEGKVRPGCEAETETNVA